jgi:hypothetical protein
LLSLGLAELAEKRGERSLVVGGVCAALDGPGNIARALSLAVAETLLGPAAELGDPLIHVGHRKISIGSPACVEGIEDRRIAQATPQQALGIFSNPLAEVSADSLAGRRSETIQGAE